MDEFLRLLTHGIVTGVLLVVWSGLLLGLTWKVLTMLWNFAQSRLLPRRSFQQARVMSQARSQFTATHYPALTANSLQMLPVDASPLLYLPPHNELAEEVLYCIPLEIEF